VGSIAGYENSEWKYGMYSCCIKIAEVIIDGKKKYPLVIGKEDCKECDIYVSLVNSMVCSLNNTLHNFGFESNGQFTVYGILILNNGSMKAFKTTYVKTDAIPITIYPLEGLHIENNSLEVSEIVEYIIQYTFHWPHI
jgi:hypothetical protein